MLSEEGTVLSPGKHFELSVEMAPRPPAPPNLKAHHRGNLVHLAVDDAQNGGAPVQMVTISLRKIFGAPSKLNGGRCRFIELPKCADSDIPCWEASGNSSKKFVLVNLPYASRFEVQVSATNEAGQSGSSLGLIGTVARENEPWSTCQVKGWVCGYETYVENVYPEADDPECQLNTPPLPICKVKAKSSCDGKKYWETCVPLMSSESDAKCAQVNGKFPQKLCTHILGNTGNSSTDNHCKVPGCYKPATGLAWLKSAKKCCCTPGKESDPEPDSPHCACSYKSCSDLGLVAAVDPLVSCRH